MSGSNGTVPHPPPTVAPRPIPLRRRGSRAAGLLAVALAGAAAATAQEKAGEFLEAGTSAARDPFSECSTPAWPPAGEEVACDVVEAIVLQAPVEAWLLRYHRSAEVPEGEVTAVVEVEELALIEAAGGGYRVVWRLPVDLRFQRLATGAITQVGGATVVDYSACLPSCVQQFLAWDGGWRALRQPFVDRLAALAPPDWSLGQGRRVDLASMTGTQPLVGPPGANCCASGSIRFTVALDGDALVLVDATVEVPEPEPADSGQAAPPDSAGESRDD